jgi:uncharacterized repeat protein (TIGR01451 family)
MRRFAPRTRILILMALTCLLALPLARATTNIANSGTAPATVTPTVSSPVAFGASKPLRDLARTQTPTGKGVPAQGGMGEEADANEALIHPTGNGSALGVDPVLQQGAAGSGIPPTGQNFEGNDIGESSSDGVFIGAPPDTNGDVGPNHYVQTVNTVLSIYSKTGQRLVGPTPLNNIWKSAPNAAQFNCTLQSRGDPVVQYDPLADRWVITQFNFPGVAVIAPPFDECIAVSKTGDPTGEYWLYDFNYSATIFNDYPHFGVWGDAYYMSVNQFDTTTENTDFHSAGACAFERAKMIAGDAGARQVCFDESTFDPKDANGNYIYGGQLPADLDGTTPPPAGEPNFFMQFLDSTTAGKDKLLEFKFHVDWNNPANSTFGNGTANGNGKPVEIPVADFSVVCNGDQTVDDRNCLPQKDSPDGLDSIGDRLMYRLGYRNFGDHESIVANHTVNVGDTAKHAGIRWYEIRSPNATPQVYQQSTFAPDAEHRWMGSIGMDSAGDIALGYSLTSSNRHPAIAYTARRASDPLGQMSMGEGLLYQGLGSQTGTNSRWGDYSSMSVDPNGCTFWYTQEHYLGTDTFNWGTRIGSFTLPVCGDPQLSLGASTSLVQVRRDYTYTIGVNSGQNPALGASVRDDLPNGVTLLSATSTRGTCKGSNTVVCNLGDLPAGDLETITLTVHTRAAGNLTNTATLSVSSPDSNPNNNSASVSTQVFNPCVAPGAVMATDPSGDATTSPAPQQDLTSVAIGEPYFAPNTNKLVFTMKVQNLDPTPQPGSFWYEHFSYGGVSYFVDMETNTSTTKSPTFHYGRFDVDPTSGLNTQKVLGDADSGTWNTDGTITITLSNSKLNQVANPASPPTGTPPSAGSLISGIHGETRQVVGVLLALIDTTSSGGYTLSGNDFCAPNTPPKAALQATPTSGSAPLAVTFNGSGSSDPDAGDHVASYTFRFGDDSTPVTQSSPTTSHTYSDPGTYHVTLTVTDSRGDESTNAASKDITVTPTADLAVDAIGPASAKNDTLATYTITVKNNGPAAATGVVATDKLPFKAEFKSVKSSPAATCTKASASSVTTVTCKLGTIASGATTTITIVAKLRGTVGAVLTNTASATETGPGDPNSGNNTSIVSTTVTR